MNSLIQLSFSGTSLFRWVPFHIAQPLLDRQPYVVLSDFFQNGQSIPHVSKNLMEIQHGERNEEHSNDIDDGEMDCADFANSDGDVSNILIGLKQSFVRFKVRLHNAVKKSKRGGKTKKK